MSEIIGQISKSQNVIAGAVEVQTAMTSKISRNIAEVAAGSGEIAQSISLVADAAKNTAAGSEETLSTAADIESMAAELMSLVGDVSSTIIHHQSPNATISGSYFFPNYQSPAGS